MKKTSLALLGLSLSSVALACPRPWVCESLSLKIPAGGTAVTRYHRVKIRAGYLPEESAFRGNVIYYQGLGDSMLNHAPLFSKLTRSGFRVISFDYMGQGGSTGTMNNTRITDIPKVGDVVWKKLARDLGRFPQKNIIGWSTGGLAAYFDASRGAADKVVLIAPGIVPKKIVGAGLINWIPNEITLESLTTDQYLGQERDPHVDPINPRSPLLVPDFAVNLLWTAHKSEGWKIPQSVRGLVLLSGTEDTYVKARETKDVLSANAAHFLVTSFPGALHEIDNEVRPIREAAHLQILKFLLN